MAEGLSAPPVLSTPETNIFEHPAQSVQDSKPPPLSEDELYTTYEIHRTIREIRQGRWRRIALQFPDAMLVDAPRVFEALDRGLKQDSGKEDEHEHPKPTENGSGLSTKGYDHLETAVTGMGQLSVATKETDAGHHEHKLYILGDTSYGACCVDEIAAEHADAEVVVHYGRSCLSPTARLPVIYVFTSRAVDTQALIQSFKGTFPERTTKVILMADVTYSTHVSTIYDTLRGEGYANLFATSIIHSPGSLLPNRTVPEAVSTGAESLQDYQLFHISQPPTSLLLTLSSRLGSIYIYPTTQKSTGAEATPLVTSTALALRRRYALITSLSSVSIFGILINTLSVKNYLHIVELVKSQIAAAGKKSYTFVVGKVNAAKIANFSEVGGWVVIGCWESSLVENEEFWKPVITPFELELALQRDDERVWTGEWRSDFNGILDDDKKEKITGTQGRSDDSGPVDRGDEAASDMQDLESEPESAPPEFDLRTGRYVANSRLMPVTAPESSSPHSSAQSGKSSALIKRANVDLASIAGQVSPGAEFLRSKRTWRGLGSDFTVAYEDTGEQGTAIEQGRSGIARGYSVDDGEART